MKPDSRGWTLVELVVVTAVVAVLMSLAFPSFDRVMQSNQAATGINWLIGSIRFARYSAIMNHTMVTICPSRNGHQCGGKWHEGTIVFTDKNANATVDKEDRILKRFRFPVQGATITWRAFGNRQYLQITPIGYTNFMNGNFTYCSADRNPRFSRQIVINMPGRVRRAYDVDGDGIIEDYRGRELRC